MDTKRRPEAERFPRAFGRYSLLAPLAEGGMGALYLGCQGERGLEKLCVIKTVLPQLADAEYVARFRDEAKVVVRLSHGNLVPVFDAGTVRIADRDELYLAMEHVDGKDLRAVWNRCAQKGVAFPVDIAAYIARELARGLHHAHTTGDIGLVHRDVSPPNVLLSFAGEVKLTDFGLAASAIKKEKTAPGVIYGKVSYMSPEQARGEQLDGRTDLFAVGVILWELLTGRQLFPQAEVNLIERVRAPVIDPPSRLTARVPQELDEIVVRALEPDRHSRFADCDGFRAALAGFLAKTAPTIDNERVSSFLRHLFSDEIDRDRRARTELLEALHVDPEHSAQPTAVAAAAVALTATRPGNTEVPVHGAGDTSGLIGSLLDGKYQVRRIIGEGGMGLVYEAEHIDIGRKVAIKILHPAFTRSPDVVARFRSEARAATRVGHPHIIDVFDSGTTVDGAVYLVMEHLEGRDLGWVIGDSAPLDIARAGAIGKDICEALAAAHKAGILHRDLKPENIFLIDRADRRDFVKVLDFGIAKTIDSVTDRSAHHTSPGVAMGTPEYMAPEQAAGLDVDARADIYSVGAILYEMLSGRAPHEGNNVMEVLTKKATVIPTSLRVLRPEVPAALVSLVDRALSREPGDRPASMRVMADELSALLDDRDSALNRRQGDRRNRNEGTTLRTSIIVAAGALVLFGGLVLWPGSGAKSPVQERPPIVTEAPTRKPVSPRPVVAPPAEEPLPPPPVRVPPAVASKEPTRPHPKLPPVAKSVADVHDGSAQEAKKKLLDARQAMSAGKYAQAETLFNQVRSMNVESGAATTGLAEVAFQRGNYEEAARIGKRAVDTGGGASARMVLGNSKFRLKLFDEAIEQYRAVLKTTPKREEARDNLAAAMAHRGR